MDAVRLSASCVEYKDCDTSLAASSLNSSLESSGLVMTSPPATVVEGESLQLDCPAGQITDQGQTGYSLQCTGPDQWAAAAWPVCRNKAQTVTSSLVRQSDQKHVAL